MSDALVPSRDCSCNDCVKACEHEPGRFAPGEAERAAKFMGLSFARFRRRFLVKDYWSGDDGACCWAPRKVGAERPSSPDEPVSYGYALKSGPCVFLQAGRCSIHEAKPLECRVSICDAPKNHRSEINRLWLDAGSPIGKAPDAGLGEALGAIFEGFLGRSW